MYESEKYRENILRPMVDQNFTRESLDAQILHNYTSSLDTDKKKACFFFLYYSFVLLFSTFTSCASVKRTLADKVPTDSSIACVLYAIMEVFLDIDFTKHISVLNY